MPPTLRVAQLDFADPAFPVSLVLTTPADLPGPDWARVDIAAAGICGSDLHVFTRATGPSPALSGYGVLPMQMGHEIAGYVSEAGPECPIPVGTAVAVDPVIACEARGIDPICAQCAAGHASACHNFGSRVLTPGMGLGFTQGLGGGWGDHVLAHRSMLHPLPPGVTPSVAPLHEPLSIAIHGLFRHPPRGGDHVLVVGAGVIGLCAVAAVGSLFPGCPITVLAKYPHQAAAARALGATDVVFFGSDHTHFPALAELAGTTVRGHGGGAMLAGGFPYVIEAVGTEAAVNETLRFVDGRGTLLLLGAAGVSTVDLTPVWFKEIALVGSFCHATDGDAHSIDRALAMLAAGVLPPEVVITHTFPLAALRDAITVALDRASGAIKVMLVP